MVGQYIKAEVERKKSPDACQIHFTLVGADHTVCMYLNENRQHYNSLSSGTAVADLSCELVAHSVISDN